MDYGYLIAGDSVGGIRSRWCESRVWQPLGHRTVSLESPCLGVRNPGLHYRQVWNEVQSGEENAKCHASTHFLCVLQELARRLASSGRYKVFWVFDKGSLGLEKRYSNGSVEFRCRKYTVGSDVVLWIVEAERGWRKLKHGMFVGKVDSEVTEWWRYKRSLWHKWRSRGMGKDGKGKEGGRQWFKHVVKLQ
ncbi:hypothetical protein V6N13_051360 [Hibiscus sabdariffa]|uniref:Uncharacterized protein n=1 Tax=Hibiscus sabdariffa TaxID=183260 RepID=A0ABR2T3A7_9ROSI